MRTHVHSQRVGALGRAWAPLVAGDAAQVCIAGVALGTFHHYHHLWIAGMSGKNLFRYRCAYFNGFIIMNMGSLQHRLFQGVALLCAQHVRWSKVLSSQSGAYRIGPTSTAGIAFGINHKSHRISSCIKFLRWKLGHYLDDVS